jgi:hypothetical protein
MPRVIADAGLLDLDDLGAKVGQQLRCPGTCQYTA